MADGGGVADAVLGYPFRGAGGVVILDKLDARVTGKIVPALHQRHRVRVHLMYVLHPLRGKGAETVRDVCLVLADNRRTAVAQQFVVVQQRTRDGVLYGCQPDDGGVVLHLCEDLLESVAAVYLQLLAFKIFVGGDVVEAAFHALDSYAFQFLVLFLCCLMYASLPAYEKAPPQGAA